MNHDTKKNRDEETPDDILTPETRAALLALSYDEAFDLLEKEEPAALALATELVLAYSDQVGELLKQGKDYLQLLTPSENTPAMERMAMDLVLETVEEELDSEE